MEKLKVIELFAGIGAYSKALDRLNINYEVVSAIEKDEKTIKSYNIMHNSNYQATDITTLDEKILPNCDMICYSPPCFPKGALILTDKGYKVIEDILIGDYVITHTNTYKKVIKLYTNDANEITEIKAQGTLPIQCTPDHPFYIREMYKIWDNDNRTYKKIFSEPKWKNAKELSKSDYIGIAINQKNNIPIWNGISVTKWTKHQNTLSEKFSDKQFWYFVGRYMGDGWTLNYRNANKNVYRTMLCCSHEELEYLESKIYGLFKYNITKERTTYKLEINNKELNIYLQQFGKYAPNKIITNDIIDLPKELLKEFLSGYFDSDGCLKKDESISFATTSIKLAYGIGQVIAKLYNYPYQIIKTHLEGNIEIEGRSVKNKDCYRVQYTKNQKEGFFEDGIVWVPIRGVDIKNKDCTVYNFEVEEDNSYTINNIIVHNCQAFSNAGKQLGFEDKRGILFFDALRIIKEKMPKYCIMENVKGLTQKKFQNEFKEMLNSLEEIGYKNYWKVLNAKWYSAAQNRERVFVMSIRNDIVQEFVFPEGFDIGLRLKDLLESDVDEKYYIKQELADELLNKINGRGFIDRHGIQMIGMLEIRGIEQIRRVYDPRGLSPTINTMQGGGRIPKIIIGNKIRELTPLECFRVMNFDDEDYYILNKNSVPKTQILKMAGNSIAVGVLEAIFKNLFQNT